MNFTAYRLSLKGLGGGTFFSRSKGIFEGFEQGTEEYYKLMERYLGQIENNLEKYGLLGKEYIYWFDESADRDYPFVRETNELIKKYAPKITTFITEHVKDHDISDVTDISCTIWDKLNHDKNTYTGKPVPSLRLEILRDGIEDYEYFMMLEKAVESASNKNKATISEAK